MGQPRINLVRAEIFVGPLLDPLLFQHCSRQFTGVGPLPGRAKKTLRPAGELPTAVYRLTAQAWRPLYGGILFSVCDPTGAAVRVAASFLDAEAARQVWQLHLTNRHAGLTLQKLDGRWFALLRFYAPRPKPRPRIRRPFFDRVSPNWTYSAAGGAKRS